MLKLISLLHEPILVQDYAAICLIDIKFTFNMHINQVRISDNCTDTTTNLTKYDLMSTLRTCNK